MDVVVGGGGAVGEHHLDIRQGIMVTDTAYHLGISGIGIIHYGVTDDAANPGIGVLRLQLADEFEELFPDCDIELQSGGQPLYYYLIAVE